MRIILIALFVCASASAEWSKGFNFRASSGSVSDGTNEARITEATTYPTTVLATSVGWTVAPTGSATRSTGVDRRLTGINYQQDTAGTAIFRVDLPAPGTYYIKLALGDVTDPQTGQYLQVLDGTTPVLTVDSSGGTAIGHYLDATGTDYSISAWPASNTAVTVTFATTTLYIKLGTNAYSGYSTLAHFSITDTVGGGGGGGGGGAVAVTNKITIHNSTGSTVNQPYTISRFFRQGEIPNNAAPSGITQWQGNVKTRWPDGSVQHELITFWQSTADGAADAITFVNTTDVCYLGDQATCDAAALDGAGMLAFNGGAWGAGINTTAAGVGGSVTSSARAMITAGKFSYWIKGPLATVAIAEDRTSARSYDYGYTCATNCTTTYSTATWTADTTYKSLHPMFILTFFPGWAGVYIEAIMQNGWTTAVQDQAYSVSLLSGSALGTTVKSSTFVPQAAFTQWVYRFWSGTATTFTFPSSATLFDAAGGAPTTFYIDYNLAYIIASKIIPNHDQTIDVTAYVASEYTDSYVANMGGAEPFYNPGATYFGSMVSYIQSSGGRGDIGLNPRWFIRYLFSMDPRLYAVMMGNGDLAGTTPYHIWESETGRFFDGAGTVDAFGRPVSVDARPTFRIGWYPDLTKTGTVLADQAQPIGSYTKPSGWTPEYDQTSCAHQANYSYVPYIITGDYFYLMDFQAINATYLTRNRSENYDNRRHGNWGITAYDEDQTRGTAWGLRSHGDVTFMSPDASPEKNYFAEKLENNLAAFEAWGAITDGHYYATCDPETFNVDTETNPYCWAKLGSAFSRNDLHLPFCRVCHVDYVGTEYRAADAMWQGSLVNVAFGHLAELGFNADVLARESATLHLAYAKDTTLGARPGWAKFQLEGDYTPVVSIGDSSSTTLNGAINSSTRTIVVTAIQPWMISANLPFHIYLNDTEKVRICGISGTTLTACTTGRGAMGSTAVSHANLVKLGAVYDIGPYKQTMTDLYNLLAAPLPNETYVTTWSGGCYAHSTQWLDMLAGTVPVCWATANDSEFGHGYLGLAGLVYSGDRATWQTIRDLQEPDWNIQGNPKFAIMPRDAAISIIYTGVFGMTGNVTVH